MFLTASKTRMAALGLGLSLAFPAVGLGQAAPSPAADPGASLGKIGIVNIQEAIMNSNEGKQESAALQQKFGSRQAALKSLNDEVQNLKKQYQAQESKLSNEEKGNRAKTIEDKQKTLQRNAEDFQNDVQQAEQEVINRIGQKMLAVLDKYARSNGYAVIIDTSSPQTPVLFANQGNVITKQLVDEYNAESGIVTPPAARAPAHPTPGATPRKP